MFCEVVLIKRISITITGLYILTFITGEMLT